MKKTLWLWICAAVLITLAGCETVKGVGRDITGASTLVQQGFAKKS